MGRTKDIATSSAVGSGAAVDSTEHLTQAVPTSSAVIVYAFNAAEDLVDGLTTVASDGGSPNHRHGSNTAVGGDADERRKCVLVRAAADGDSDGGDGRSGGSGGGFGAALAAGLSRPVLAEEMGETHLWVVDTRGRRHLAAAFVSLQRATVFLTLTASEQFPPFRMENRSSAESLAYRQVQVNKRVGRELARAEYWGCGALT